MINTKLYRVLSKFSKKDLNRLDKFIRSPYFNTNEEAIRLFELIFFSIKENKEYNEKEAWASISDDKIFDAKKWRKTLSNLLSLVESFIIQENLEKDPLAKYEYLLKGIKKNKIEILEKKISQNSIKSSERRTEQSGDYFYRRYQIEKNVYNLTTEFQKKAQKKNISAAEDMMELTKTLDLFYLIEKMRHGIELLTWKRMYKSEIDLVQFEFTAKLIERSNYLEIPGVNMYYQIYKALVNQENETNFFTLKELINTHLDEFPWEEQQEIIRSTINYCIGKGRADAKFIQEALQFYNKGIESGLLLVDDELSPTTFRNVVISALRSGFIDFASNFVNEKVNLLNRKYRDNALNFNLARIHWYKKEHDEVISYLSKVDFEDIWYNINSKTMLIATYYETEEFGVLENLITSFAVFIRREKSMEENRRRAYLNFLKMIGKLIKVFPITNEKLIKLEQEIMSLSPMISKSWILEKIEELKK